MPVETKTVEELHRAIKIRRDDFLKEIFESRGVEFDEGIKETVEVYYPTDPQALADYQYKGETILRVRWKGLGVEFYLPETS